MWEEPYLKDEPKDCISTLVQHKMHVPVEFEHAKITAEWYLAAKAQELLYDNTPLGVKESKDIAYWVADYIMVDGMSQDAAMKRALEENGVGNYYERVRR